MNKEKISLLLLVHNEASTIEQEIKEIISCLKEISNLEIVVVQDGSNDGTYEKLINLNQQYFFKLNSVKERRGYAKAFIDGVNSCSGNIMLFSDTGKKYDYKNFYEFLRIFKEGNLDLLTGYRVERKDKIIRRILSFFYTKYCNILFLRRYQDYDCGFKIFNRNKLLSILNKYDLNKYLITSQILIYFIISNYKIDQMPIKYLEDKNRTSRGIPTYKIINVILTTIIHLIKIKIKFNRRS